MQSSFDRVRRSNEIFNKNKILLEKLKAISNRQPFSKPNDHSSVMYR